MEKIKADSGPLELSFWSYSLANAQRCQSLAHIELVLLMNAIGITHAERRRQRCASSDSSCCRLPSLV